MELLLTITLLHHLRSRAQVFTRWLVYTLHTLSSVSFSYLSYWYVPCAATSLWSTIGLSWLEKCTGTSLMVYGCLCLPSYIYCHSSDERKFLHEGMRCSHVFIPSVISENRIAMLCIFSSYPFFFKKILLNITDSSQKYGNMYKMYDLWVNCSAQEYRKDSKHERYHTRRWSHCYSSKK